jgi:multimeric flavodoxin WrbA
VQVEWLRAAEAQPDDVLAANGYLFCAPEHLASLSGPMKDFFDRCYYPALDRIGGRAYALMVCAGSDGSGAVRQVERICTGWRLRQVAPALIVCTHAQTPAAILAPKLIAEPDLGRCRERGAALAAGLADGVF